MKRQLCQRMRRIVVGDDNPLRRYVDRLECALTVSFVIAFLVAAPLLAFVTVRAVAAGAAREQQTEQAWRQVRAITTQSAAAGIVGLDGEWDTSWVTARWTAPDGARVRGMVPVELNARAGHHLMIWVTPTGDPTHARLTTAEVIDREAMTAISVPAGLALLLLLSSWAIRVVANRRRMAAWTKAWENIGPRWSSLR